LHDDTPQLTSVSPTDAVGLAVLRAFTNSAEIASIADTVLAGLRPKMVEEISRKMKKKK